MSALRIRSKDSYGRPLVPAWFDQRKQEGINVIAQIGAHYHVVHTDSRGGVASMQLSLVVTFLIERWYKLDSHSRVEILRKLE